MIFLLFLAGLIAAGMAYQAIGTYLDRRRFPPPGQLIELGPCSLHLHEQGTGRPAVVLEAGIAGSSLGWALVQPKIAEFTRACSYDRAGLGWSGTSPAPRTVHQMISEVSTLLSCGGIPPPFILVGHSFGALLVRVYANLKREQVAGLVLVDPVPLESWAQCSLRDRRQLMLGAKLSRRGAALARSGLVRATLKALTSGSRTIPKLVARSTAGKGRTTLERLIGEVQKLPPSVWPMISSHWSRPKCFNAMAEYLLSLPEAAQTALQMSIPPDIPLIILSAINATEEELRERDSWARQSEHGKHIRVPESGHWIQLERPDAVVAAVRELVDQNRRPA